MGVAGAEELSFPRSLSLWWSEEAEGVLRRFERWAAYARGYNRLRSARLSRGRMTMGRADEDEAPWEREDRGRPEAARLRCCALGNLDYRSNARLESNCLEAYSLDHSIYFKTIGELRSEGDNGNATAGETGAGNGNAPRTVLDCGDFLASDFDEEAGEEELGDDQALRERLGSETGDLPKGLVQVCRSALSEDEVNNNIMMLGFPLGKPFPRAAAAQ